jgi:hypothetical protein
LLLRRQQQACTQASTVQQFGFCLDDIQTCGQGAVKAKAIINCLSKMGKVKTLTGGAGVTSGLYRLS